MPGAAPGGSGGGLLPLDHPNQSSHVPPSRAARPGADPAFPFLRVTSATRVRAERRAILRDFAALRAAVPV